MSTYEVSASIGALIVHAATQAGVDASELCRRTGFAMATVGDPDARIPLAVETALWDEAATLSRDPAFGLHAAMGLKPGVFDVLDYVIRTAPTLRAAIERTARYNRLVHDVATFGLVDQGAVTRIEHALPFAGATQSRHAAEFTLASISVIGAQMLGAPVRPRAVEFHHASAPPEAQDALERFFGCHAAFGRPVNALLIDAAQMDAPLPNADPVLSRVVTRHAEALLAARPTPSERTADRVRRLLVDVLVADASAASLSTIAARLKMSPRSLQRRLTDEGSSFDTVLDETRHDLALRYLGDRKVSIAEIAYLLGYSEPSAFHRAFKRWTGSTPTASRARVS